MRSPSTENRGIALAHPDLTAVVRFPGNEFCAECGAKGPRWASVNLGVLVCIDCSGTHRGMGTHISKVKSLTLDEWTNENVQVYDMLVGENELSGSIIETWIKNKYAQRMFSPPDSLEPWEFLMKGEDPRKAIPEADFSGNPLVHAGSEATTARTKKKSTKKRFTPPPSATKVVAGNDDLLDEFLPLAEVDFEPLSASSPPQKEETSLSALLSEKPIQQQYSEFDAKGPTFEQLKNAKIEAASASMRDLFDKSNPLGFGVPSFPIIEPVPIKAVSVLPCNLAPSNKKVSSVSTTPPAAYSRTSFDSVFDRSINEINKVGQKAALQSAAATEGNASRLPAVANQPKSPAANEAFNFDFGSIDESFARAFNSSTSLTPQKSPALNS